MTPAWLGPSEYGADAVLLDAANPGSGEVFDWALAGDLPEGQKLVIAGGLHAGNVAAAVSKVKTVGRRRDFGGRGVPGRQRSR